MKNLTPFIITKLKQKLTLAIIASGYNLLAPEVIALSQELDTLMNPLFKNQLSH